MKPTIAVDFDGTLATYEHWTGPGDLGNPIPKMVERVHQWLKEGKKVVIFTARVWHDGTLDRMKDAGIARSAIQEWCQRHLGQVLEITCTKDYSIVEFWDDRAVQVRPNTGEIVDPIRRAAEMVFD